MGVRGGIPADQSSYRSVNVPVAQFTAEGGFYYNFLSDVKKTVFFYAGASALAGYETVNWEKGRCMTEQG